MADAEADARHAITHRNFLSRDTNEDSGNESHLADSVSSFKCSAIEAG